MMDSNTTYRTIPRWDPVDSQIIPGPTHNLNFSWKFFGSFELNQLFKFEAGTYKILYKIEIQIMSFHGQCHFDIFFNHSNSIWKF